MKRNFFIIIFFILGLTQKSFAYSSDPKQFIQEIIDEAKKVLVDTNSKEVKISSFGTFKTINKKERIGRNPKTKEVAKISARKVVVFRASTQLKKKLNN